MGSLWKLPWSMLKFRFCWCFSAVAWAATCWLSCSHCNWSWWILKSGLENEHPCGPDNRQLWHLHQECGMTREIIGRAGQEIGQLEVNKVEDKEQMGCLNLGNGPHSPDFGAWSVVLHEWRSALPTMSQGAWTVNLPVWVIQSMDYHTFYDDKWHEQIHQCWLQVMDEEFDWYNIIVRWVHCRGVREWMGS